MLKIITTSLLVGLALGLLIVPLVLASGSESQLGEVPEWCFRQQYDSMEDFAEARKLDDSLSEVFIKVNGSKRQVYTQCSVTPLPHQYSPY